MHWAVTGSARHIVNVNWLSFDLTFAHNLSQISLTALPIEMLQQHRKLTYFTNRAEQEQRKDHFANTALRGKTEKQLWLYLVGEF